MAGPCGDAGAPTDTYVLTGRAEPLAVRDDHERRPQTGRVVAAVTAVTQQDLQRARRWSGTTEAVPHPHRSTQEHPPAQGGWGDHSVCRGHRLEGAHRRRTWRSPSCVALGSGGASSGSLPPCSPRHCRPPPRSPRLRWTPGCWPRPQSFSSCDASVCWTIEPSAASCPERGAEDLQKRQTGWDQELITPEVERSRPASAGQNLLLSTTEGMLRNISSSHL